MGIELRGKGVSKQKASTEVLARLSRTLISNLGYEAFFLGLKLQDPGPKFGRLRMTPFGLRMTDLVRTVTWINWAYPLLCGSLCPISILNVALKSMRRPARRDAKEPPSLHTEWLPILDHFDRSPTPRSPECPLISSLPPCLIYYSTPDMPAFKTPDLAQPPERLMNL